MRARGQITAALFAALLLAGCADDITLPDPADATTRADAARVASVVVADTHAREQAGAGPIGQWTCRATLLGRDGEALLADVACTGRYPGEPEESGFSGPVRVEGDAVQYAQDGSGYADSVRDLLGPELADHYLDQ